MSTKLTVACFVVLAVSAYAVYNIMQSANLTISAGHKTSTVNGTPNSKTVSKPSIAGQTDSQLTGTDRTKSNSSSNQIAVSKQNQKAIRRESYPLKRAFHFAPLKDIEYNINNLAAIRPDILTTPQKKKLVSELALQASINTMADARRIEAKVSHIVADTKYEYLKKLKAMDMTGCPEEFSETYKQFVDEFTKDEISAAAALAKLNQTPSGTNKAIDDVLKSVNQITSEQNDKIIENLTNYRNSYMASPALPQNNAMNNECLALLKDSGASKEFVDSYNDYIKAVNEGDFNAITKAAYDMNYVEFKELTDTKAIPENTQIEKTEIDTILSNLVKDTYKLNEVYGISENTEATPEDRTAAVNDLYYAKYIAETKDYWSNERPIPDHEYSEKLDESKAYLDTCADDFKAMYAQHLAAWDNLDYSEVGRTWNEMQKLTDKYKLKGTYSEEWRIDTSIPSETQISDEQRLAMEKVMEIDHELTHLRNDEINDRATEKRLDDLSNVSFTNCPSPVSDVYKEYLASQIYNTDTTTNISATITNKTEILEHASNKVDTVFTEYLNTNAPAQTP